MEIRIAATVVRGARVLTPVEFHDQPVFEAGEIGYVRSDRALAAEAVSRQLPAPQVKPESLFGLGHPAAQRARDITFLQVSHAGTPI